MFRPRHISPEPRRGIVLLVVLSMLTLFSIIGLSFVLVAQSQAEQAQNAAAAQNFTAADIDMEVAAREFLSALIYGRDSTRSPRSIFVNPNCTLAGSLMLPGGTTPGPGSDATFPDNNNAYLAAIKADGTPLAYSFVRTGLNLRAPVPSPERTANKPCDVLNLIGRSTDNDSVWTDMGYPIMTTADGIRYVPLFAACVVDLNGKIDINVHGNVRAGTQGHASNQGWGPWEVSLMQVMNLAGPSGEWAYLITGSPNIPTLSGRYGPGGNSILPAPPNTPATFNPLPQYTGPHFYSCTDFDATKGTTSTYAPSAPRFTMPTGTNAFPMFPNASSNPQGGYDNANAAEVKDHPYLYDVSKQRFGLWNMEWMYRYNDTGSPMMNCEPFQLCPNTFQNTQINSQVRWMLSAGGSYVKDRPGLSRADLNKTLTPYPLPGANGQITDLATFNQAQTDRQNLAQAIYKNLKSATGVPDTDTNTSRQLAQLAVNIVDFIDDDDYSTPFNWNGSEWVFGTELPRLVLNEAYVEYTTSGTSTTVNVWAELLNPLTTDATLRENGNARLDGAYQVVITAPNANIRAATNLLGDPDGQVLSTVSSFNSTIVQPSNGGPNGQGYCLLGPSAIPGGGSAPTVTSAQMTYTTGATPQAPTLLLRRLACPALPAQPTPGQANYNPYITVDYMENVALNNTTTAIGSRASVGRIHPYAGNSTLLTAQTATPANQPKHTFLSSNNSMPASLNWLVHLDRQLVNPMELMNVSCYKPHELTQQFATGTTAAPVWYCHLAPWFGQNTGIPNQPNLLNLYRAFEYLETHNRATGTPQPAADGTTAGRMPGMINPNTAWDLQVFRGLCDPQACNGFTQPQVDALFNAINAQRLSGNSLNPNFKPFKGLRDQLAQAPASIEDTFLRTADGTGNPASARFFEVPGQTHPYAKYELMTKIYNNLTSRSHVFAVWVTVGFFRVNDDNTFGAEINRSENKHIRHRMFAIVDRSVLTSNPGPQLHFDPKAATSPGAAANQRVVPYYNIID